MRENVLLSGSKNFYVSSQDWKIFHRSNNVTSVTRTAVDKVKKIDEAKRFVMFHSSKINNQVFNFIYSPSFKEVHCIACSLSIQLFKKELELLAWKKCFEMFTNDFRERHMSIYERAAKCIRQGIPQLNEHLALINNSEMNKK